MEGLSNKNGEGDVIQTQDRKQAIIKSNPENIRNLKNLSMLFNFT